MSLIDAPMALIDRLIRRNAPTVLADDPIARLVARTTGRLRPDAAYQRRLRGRLMNQYVAMREGLVPVPAARRGMGPLGRSVLYASFGIAVSATAVGAASTQALPGDGLYPVKLELEGVRMAIAPPSVKPMLAAAALDTRLSEVERLAVAGRWALVPLAAEEASEAETALAAMGGAPSAEAAQGLARHRKTLATLLAAAPASARDGLALALAASTPPTHAATGGAKGGGSGAVNGNARAYDSDNANGDAGNRGAGNGQGAYGAQPGTGGSSGAPGGGQATPTTEATQSPAAGPSAPAHTSPPHVTRPPRPTASPRASDPNGDEHDQPE